jgi:hypothetical protein
MSTLGKTTSTYELSSDSEDELDWEEVAVPQVQHIELEEQAGPSISSNIEVTLEAYPTQRKGEKQYAVFLSLINERIEAALQEEVSWWNLAC